MATSGESDYFNKMQDGLFACLGKHIATKVAPGLIVALLPAIGYGIVWLVESNYKQALRQEQMQAAILANTKANESQDVHLQQLDHKLDVIDTWIRLQGPLSVPKQP